MLIFILSDALLTKNADLCLLLVWLADAVLCVADVGPRIPSRHRTVRWDSRDWLNFAFIKMCIDKYLKNIHNFLKMTELKMTESKYGSLLVFISKKHCRATLKNLLADGRGGWVADCRLCRSRVAAKFSFSYFHKNFNFVLCEIFVEFRQIHHYFVKILCFAKFWQNNLEFCKIRGKFRKTWN